MTVIYLGCRLPGTSSDLPAPPAADSNRADHSFSSRRSGTKAGHTWSCTGRGLPCPATHVLGGGLLLHHFTFSRYPRASGCVFSVALSPAYAGSPLATALSCGVRTFLPSTTPEERPSGLLWKIECCLSRAGSGLEFCLITQAIMQQLG